MNLHEIQDHFYHLCFDDTWPEGEKRRTIYRRLVYNGIRTSITNALPIFFAMLGPRREKQVVREFLHKAKPQSRFYRDIPKNFMAFLVQSGFAAEAPYPFFLELADFEYGDYTLISQQGPEQIPGNALGKLVLETRPVLNPNLHLRRYRYPVHRISKADDPSTIHEEESQLLLFRNPENYTIDCLAISDAEMRFVEIMLEDPQRNLAQILDTFGKESAPLLSFLKTLLNRRIVLAMV